MLKVAIVGTGMIAGSAHIPAYRSRSDVFTVEAVVDINETAARDTAEKYGVPHWFTDCNQMLETVKPDLVSICVPNAFHKQYILTALEHGANVLCEKPVAVTYADAMELYSMAEKQGKLLIACQTMRYTPDRLALKKFIQDGQLGDIYHAEFSRIRRRGIPFWGTFHMKKFGCGGAMIDIGVHMLDAMLWLMGNPEVEAVTANTMKNHAHEIGDFVSSGARTGSVANVRKFNPDEMDVEDFAAGTIRFKNGTMANFTCAWAANMPECSDIRLIGQKRGVFIPDGSIWMGADGEEKLEVLPDPFEKEAFPGHVHVIRHLADVFTNGAELEITPAQTIQVSAVLDMIYRSAAEKRTVSFEELL